MRALLLVAACASCAPAVTAEADCPFSSEDVDAFAQDFRTSYYARFGEDPVIAPLFVECQQTRLVDYLWGTRWYRQKALGTTLARDHVLVGTEGLRVMAHELVHVALLELTGDGDADHAEGDGGWTEEHNDLIEDINAARGDQ